MTPTKLSLTLLLMGCALTASAQMDPNMKMDSQDTKFMQEMTASMKQMDQGMASAPMNGNTDHDFVSMMVPHHQGAIDMAKGELTYGKDPELRRLAKQIISDQHAEIEMMNKWLKNHPGEKSTP